MRLSCLIGRHKWSTYSPCRCRNCSAARHIISGCRCERCGIYFHDWELTDSTDEFEDWRCRLCGETKRTSKPCEHEWELISTETTEDEFSYESGNQYLISEGGVYYSYRCRKCGAEKTEVERN